MVMVAQLCECTKDRRIAYFNRVTFIVCVLCLNKAVVKRENKQTSGSPTSGFLQVPPLSTHNLSYRHSPLANGILLVLLMLT